MSQANLLLYDNSGAVVSSFSVGNTCGKATLAYDFCLPAKSLKIALPRTGVIHIYEAQVFDYTGTNRALASSGAVASQISTFSWGSTPCSASIAIDGNTVEDSSRACDGMSHTTTPDLYAWWQVKMPDTFSISRMVIYNRQDSSSYPNLSANLANAAVALMDEYENVIGLVANIGDTQGKYGITLNSGDFSRLNSVCRDLIEQIKGVWCWHAGSKINIARCGGVDIWNPATHLECTDTQNQYWSIRCSDGTYSVLKRCENLMCTHSL
jgi:hypothetical protein